MIFPPHIAPPCNFPCCRPSSSSVPRCSIGRQNSFSLSMDQRSPTPPRPPPLRHEINYNSTPNTPVGKLKQPNCVYKVIPIIKPASSMPGGLATKTSCMQLANGANDMLNDNVTSQYHSSQPNLLSSLSIGNMNSTTTDPAMNSNFDGNLKNDSCSGVICGGSTRIIGRTPHSVEPRTTAYYYNELIKKPAIFDSNLNLLNETMKEEKTIPECNNIKTSEQSKTIFRSATSAPVAAIGTSVINSNTISLAPQKGYHNLCLSTRNNEDNNETDTASGSAFNNGGGASDDGNGYFKVSKTFAEYASSSSQFINNGNRKQVDMQAAAQDDNFSPTPADRNFSTANPSSASLVKTSTSAGIHNHIINKKIYYTSRKPCSASGDSNNIFGSSNQRLA